MKKTLLFIIAIFSANLTISQMKTLHDFKVNAIEGEEFSLASLKNKKVLVVNTASECGLTPQYKELQELYQKYGGEKFTIIGFPANNFMGQEPGNNSEIKSFCQKNYGVTFQMMEKISVKGKDIHPLYGWLTKKEENGVQNADVKWNFQKFMIDENGKWVGVVSPQTSPLCNEIVNWINGTEPSDR